LKITRLTLLFTAFCVICAIGPPFSWGQEIPTVSTTPPDSKPADSTVIITADGQNTYLGDIATADDNVIVHYRDDIIFADHVIYDRSRKVLTAHGNARIYSGKRVYRGDTIIYNLVTKAITSDAFLGEEYPHLISGTKVTTPDFNHYRLTNATFTTNNREKPTFHLAASTVEYRPNDEVVLKNVLVYVGDVPILYFPILVQSLTDSRPAYQFEIGNSTTFGAFIDNKYNWVADSKIRGDTTFDYREKRGFAGGVDVQYFPSLDSDILLKTYYAHDHLYSQTDPGFPNTPFRGNISNPNVYDGITSEDRYRVSYEHHLQFGPDFSSIADLNLWSDPWVTRDYFPSEYQQENQPPNFVQLNEYNPDFTISLMASPQVNPFFETVERLPEFMVESKQQKIFGTNIEYSSTSSVVNFERHFADVSDFRSPNLYIYNSFPNSTAVPATAYSYYHPNVGYGYNTAEQNNYSAYRYDTYHELAYPHQYFDFLSLTPRIGGRFTYYSDTNQDTNDTVNNDGLSSDKITNPKARLAADAGLSGDFKISRTWADFNLPNLGIQGIRHVIEPFFDAQYAPSPTVTPDQIRGFDDRLYSTQLQPLDWTEYNSIDSIDRQAVVRFGVWNKIQTKRDGVNYDLLTWQTYLDADFDHNFSSATPNSTLSNIFNNITYNFTQQLSFTSFSALDVSGGGYNQVDNSINWSPDPSLKLSVGDHYINHSPLFGDSHNDSIDLFYRMNEHWQFEGQEQFESATGRLQLQQYTVYRDLDSWQLSLTYSDAEIINGHNDQSVFFSLSLKALPQFELHTPRL
jgi:LPS-assembly protein